MSVDKTIQKEHLSGSVERVTFHSETTGFCVLKVKVKGQRDLVTVVGSSARVGSGEYIDCEGVWVTNREYGLQFKADHLSVILPSTLEGIEKYLGSGLVKGIGPHFAKKLVKMFGQTVFEVIEKTPDRLMELPGIGVTRRDGVIKSWSDQKKIREIVVFLQSHGVGTARAVRIYKTYGQDAILKVRENPYRLALDIHGIGFKTADMLAERLGISKQSILRAAAGVRHVLYEYSQEGHCAMMLQKLIEEAVVLLEIPQETIEEAIHEEIAAGRLIPESAPEGEGTLIFLVHFYKAEVNVANALKRLSKGHTTWSSKIDVENAIVWVENKTQLKLSATQRDALRVALQHKIVIITGGPGVGKTTLLNSLLKIIRTQTDKVILGAPTGRAAKRLSDSTGLEAKTVHRLLEFDPQTRGFKRDEQYPLEADLVVIDEMSMIDISLMNHLLKAVPSEAGLLLVGDVDQLPSVGPGAVLANLIDSECIPTVRLTEIFRQAKTSQIVVNAHRVNQGYLPKIEKEATSAKNKPLTDFYFIEANTPELIHEKLIQVVTERIPLRFGFDPIRQIQVLVPMNRGGLGASTLNIELQKQLNPNGNNKIMRFGCSYAEGDKVIQTVNNYQKEVFNGDIGFITNIDLEESEATVLFEGRLVTYDFDELDELSLAYATTIHKSQGSEYPAVVIPISMQHYLLLQRNLLYTGLTRGKSLVVIIGQLKAVGMAVRTIRSTKRLTNLTNRIIGRLPVALN